MRHALKMSVVVRKENDERGNPIHYQVSGMPAGEEAAIWRPPHGRWQFRRTTDGVIGEWTGDYETAEDALQALESDVNQ